MKQHYDAEQADRLAELVAAIDGVTASMARLPGHTPQDARVAIGLLDYTISIVHGESRLLLLINLEADGVQPAEATALARALAGLALRLGAWLGRER